MPMALHTERGAKADWPSGSSRLRGLKYVIAPFWRSPIYGSLSMAALPVAKIDNGLVQGVSEQGLTNISIYVDLQDETDPTSLASYVGAACRAHPTTARLALRLRTFTDHRLEVRDVVSDSHPTV